MADRKTNTREWFIYVLFDGGGDFYVGRTFRPSRRLADHRSRFGQQTQMRVIESGFGFDGATSAEIKWIEKFLTDGVPLKNKRITASGMWDVTDELRAKLRIATRKTQYKSGVNNFELLSDEAKQRKRDAAKRNWDGIPPAERTRRAVERNEAMWGARSFEHRRELGKAILASRIAKRSLEVIQKEARENGKLAVSNFWNKLTPEAREEFIRKRTAKSQAAKAAKRAAREQTALS